METAADLLRDLGFLLYGGPMVAFTVLVLLADALPSMRPWDIVRAFRAWGPGFGLALGTCVFGALAGHWLRRGGFVWGWQTAAEKLELAAWLVFFALWVSNVKLEIWTLEPLRKLDPPAGVSDPDAYVRALGPLRRHMVAHAAMVLAVVVLAEVARG